MTNDIDGNRVEQATASGITKYLVDTNRSLAQVLAEYKNDGSLLASYVYADDLISMMRNGQTFYYHFDGLGSTRLLTNGFGVVTDTYSYDAFGNLIQRTGSTDNPFLFTGQQYDPNIGFYYLRARYMNPSIGRFTAVDPFDGDPFAPMTLHKYLYAGSDPVNKVDPSGEMMLTIGEIGMITGIMGVLVSMYIYVHGQSVLRNNSTEFNRLNLYTALSETLTVLSSIPEELSESYAWAWNLFRSKVYEKVDKLNDRSKFQIIIAMPTGLESTKETFTPSNPGSGPFVLIQYGGYKMRACGARVRERITGITEWIMRIDYHELPMRFPNYPFTLHYHLQNEKIHHVLWPEKITY